MRKSNKLLIGLLSFVTVLILMHFTAIAVMVAYDIRAEREVYEDEDKYTEESPEGVRTVDLSGFYNVNVEMGDSFYYRIYSTKERTTYTAEQNSDKLILNGFNTRLDTIYRYTDEGDRIIDNIDTTEQPYSGTVTLHVTGKESLKLYQSQVQLRDVYAPLDLKIALVNSNFSGPDYKDSTAKLRRLEISSKDRSHITLNNKMKCEELHLSFSDYGMLGGSATVGSGTLRFNDSTMLSGETFGYLLRNMKMIHQPFVPTHTTDDAPGIAEEVIGP